MSSVPVLWILQERRHGAKIVKLELLKSISMKRSISIFSLALFLGAVMFTFSSCDKKGTATIYDGEMQWDNWTCAYPETWRSVKAWDICFFTANEDYYKSITLAMNTWEPGTYSGTFDPESWKWSIYPIHELSMKLDGTDYVFSDDDQPSSGGDEPSSGDDELSPDDDELFFEEDTTEWYGKSATITIHEFNKKKMTISATLEADMYQPRINKIRHIKIDMDHYPLKDKGW